MTVSLLWLNDYLKVNMTPDQISDALTSLGLEVEKVETWESIRGGLKGIVAGKVLTCVKHPDADRLSITTVDTGNGTPSTIVCGAGNIATGQTVWVATPGAELYDNTGKPFQIKISKIRGQVSEGMICAEDELGLGTSHDGIMVLPDTIEAGALASAYYNVSADTLFEIGLTPNRSDATSVLGVAADLAAYLSVQSGVFQPVSLPGIPSIQQPEVSVPFKVNVRDAAACPRYSGVLISNVTIGPSPAWMQQRLQAIGVKTINNVVDITNFVLHEMGQPLHAFDAAKITGSEIMVETKPAGTPFLALDGLMYNLHQDDLMICDGEGYPMCIGGVYGGLHSGVSEQTTTIFLEAAHFNAGSVRRSSMRHNLRTEAARRFEKGSDPNITVQALARAADLMAQYAGGKIASSVFDIYPSPVQPATIVLAHQTLNTTTGFSFSKEQVELVLDALNMPFEYNSAGQWTVHVPTNKADVLREIDVIEEVLRVFGFTNIPLPKKMYTSMAMEPGFTAHKFRRLAGQFLASRGFVEAMNLSLTQPQFYDQLDWVNPKEWVTIHNTSNESLNLLRPEMLIPTLDTIRRNVNRKQDDIRMFEFGKAYRHQNDIPAETEHLVLSMSGNVHASHWHHGPAKAVDFFVLKSEVHALLTRFGIRKWKANTITNQAGFDFGLQYQLGDLEMVRFGKVNSSLCDAFDVRQDVYVADFLVQTVLNLADRAVTLYSELNKFPAVVRDLAFVIAESTTFEAIRDVVIHHSGELLSGLEVFDIYKNPEHVGKGKMSVALRMTIENKASTLAEKDIDQWFGKIQSALAAELGAEIRK